MKELDHLRRELIDIQNIDGNESFKWCLVKYLNLTDRQPLRIKNTDKYFFQKDWF